MSFYKMDPGAWDFGTAELSLEEEAAYLRIVNAIHKHEGPVPDNDRVLAGMFRTSTRKARALVKALVAAGKIEIEDGKIWNDRARSDLVQRGFTSISRAESGAKGGRTRAENAANALKTNDPPQANASSREEKRREEEKEEPNGSSKKQVARGSRLPRDWQLPRPWGQRAVDAGMAETRVRSEAEVFRDYWIAKPGKDGTKLDWEATWRNWIKRCLERQSFQQPTRQPEFWTGRVL